MPAHANVATSTPFSAALMSADEPSRGGAAVGGVILGSTSACVFGLHVIDAFTDSVGHGLRLLLIAVIIGAGGVLLVAGVLGIMARHAHQLLRAARAVYPNDALFVTQRSVGFGRNVLTIDPAAVDRLNEIVCRNQKRVQLQPGGPYWYVVRVHDGGIDVLTGRHSTGTVLSLTSTEITSVKKSRVRFFSGRHQAVTIAVNRPGSAGVLAFSPLTKLAALPFRPEATQAAVSYIASRAGNQSGVA